MLRRGARIVVASHNEGKVRELAELFEPYGVECVSATSLGLPEPEETGASFAENAALKAEQAARTSGMIAIADDSGLEVAALGGGPGIHSARWGGQARDFGLAIEHLHCELEANGASDASANFISRSRSPRRKGVRLCSRAKSSARSLGRHAAPSASGTIRSSCPTAIVRPLGRWRE